MMQRLKIRRRGLAATIVLALMSVPVTSPVVAQDRTQRVQFARGASSATVKGQVKGDAGVTYVIGASAGQTMTVSMKTSNGANYFNVIAPGADTAMFIGSTSGNNFRGTLPANGDYRIQVYLMRSAARRNESGAFTLTVGVSGRAATSAPHASHDALVPGTDYHATANVACAFAPAAPLGACKAGVMRYPSGNSTVEITLPRGVMRRIYFDGNRATGSDSRNGAFAVRKNGDFNIITVGGSERYEFPDSFVVGG